MKNKRQKIIKEIVSSREIETQEEITALLKEKEINVTQATVSRDIKELGLIKIPGPNNTYQYALPAEQSAANNSQRLHRLVKENVIGLDCSENLIIIKTLPGGAPSVASGIDGAAWKEIIGTVAGDDNILIVVKPKESTTLVMERFIALLN